MDPNSLVDTLKQKGMASDFLSRSNLAKTYGIQNYVGSADQNTQLLQKIGGGSVASPSTVTTTTPITTTTPVVTQPDVTKTDTTQTSVSTTEKPTITPPADMSKLAKLAGEKGLSVKDFQTLLASDTSGIDKTQIYKDLGIPTLETAVFTPPSKSTESLFNEAYTTAGLDKVDTNIKSLMDEIATRRSQLAEATNAINNNPFLSEKTRVGQGKLRLDQAETAINNLNNELNVLRQWKQDQLSNISNKILLGTKDFQTNQELNAKKLDYLAKKAGDMITTGTSQAKGKAILDYLMNQPKKALTSGTYWDPATQQWIAPAGKKTAQPKGTFTSGKLTYTPQDQSEDSQALERSRGADGYVDPTTYQKLYQAWINNGGLLKDFISRYPPKNYVNPNNKWLPNYLMPTTKKGTTINDL